MAVVHHRHRGMAMRGPTVAVVRARPMGMGMGGVVMVGGARRRGGVGGRRC